MQDNMLPLQRPQLTREQIQEGQIALFNGAVERVSTTPLYKERNLRSITRLQDLENFEFTEKSDLHAKDGRQLFACERSDVREIHMTSGTTGEPIIIPYTEQDINLWAEATSAVFEGAGVKPGAWVQIAMGYGLFTGALGFHYGARKCGLGIIPTGSGETERQLKILMTLHPDVIVATPSYLLHLAELGLEKGYTKNEYQVQTALCGAEPWSEAMRVRIEELMGVKVYDNYGLSEIIGPGVAYECSARNGLHINEHLFIPEVVDPLTGKRVDLGTEGELVLTSFKKAMPLIRYRTRDITSLNYAPCSCGRPSVRMSRVIGRTDDMLIIRGVNVYPSQIEQVLFTHLPREHGHYQILIDRVRELDTVEVRVECAGTKEESSALIPALENSIKTNTGISATVTLVPPHSLPLAAGKARRVEDRR
jgi:phenylacetate-CoA ligase